MNKKICIIDDDKIYRFTTEKYLRMLDLTQDIMTFTDGEEALDFLSTNSTQREVLPDIILLDVNMPIMDGWDFVEAYMKLEQKPEKNIGIYMVTSSIDERDREKAAKLPIISGFIVKPIEEDQLQSLLQKSVA